jgi:4-hydroxybenzoate polyprenyltransferase
MSTTEIVPDSERRGLIGSLPARIRPAASLMRLDRPIGTRLLYWPCAWGVALAGARDRWDLFLWLALGAFAMRSAGCVYNDIVDRDLDKMWSVRGLGRWQAGECRSARPGSSPYSCASSAFSS